MMSGSILDYVKDNSYIVPEDKIGIAAEDSSEYLTKDILNKKIETVKKEMMKASRTQDFLEAARLRDVMFTLKAVFEEKFSK